MKKEHLVLALKQRGLHIATETIAEIILSHQAAENAIDVMLGTYEEPKLRAGYTSTYNRNEYKKLVKYNCYAHEREQVEYETQRLKIGFVQDEVDENRVKTSNQVILYETPKKDCQLPIAVITTRKDTCSVNEWEREASVSTPLYFFHEEELEKVREGLKEELEKWLEEQKAL